VKERRRPSARAFEKPSGDGKKIRGFCRDAACGWRKRKVHEEEEEEEEEDAANDDNNTTQRSRMDKLLSTSKATITTEQHKQKI